MQPGVESLNVAVAAGLVCYHARDLLRPRKLDSVD
jgi:tRNA G18 (ribose-2'-O)-methylase SpoU